jgi:hypothetical protein
MLLRPPFDEMFIETGAPSGIRGFKDVEPWPQAWPARFGFYIQHGEPSVFMESWRRRIEAGNYNIKDARSAMVLMPFIMNRSNGAPGYMGMSFQLLLDHEGRPTDNPICSMDRWHSERSRERYSVLIHANVIPIVMSLMLLNCKNVVVEGKSPEGERKLDSVRKRHGLKPFLRYHTIAIEPMKKVLRAQGHIETDGSKRALHIVRGHFATYSEERPLFGKYPGTFWMPWHVRGAASEGMVMSDYVVNAPGPKTPVLDHK